MAATISMALTGAAAAADQPLWELGAGLGLLRLPHYRGSDQTRNWLLPLPYFVYRGEFLRADREGAHAVLVDSARVDLDLSVDVSTPARSTDNLARAGMPNLAATFEVGPNLNVKLLNGPVWGLDLRVPVRAVTTLQHHPQAIGWRTGPALALGLRQAGWEFGTQLGPVGASQRYHAYFYDVAPAFATAARPTYRSSGGFGGWTLSATASRRFGDVWLGTYTAIDRLDGATFNASPLVRTRTNFSAGVGLSWIFLRSEARAFQAP